MPLGGSGVFYVSNTNRGRPATRAVATPSWVVGMAYTCVVGLQWGDEAKRENRRFAHRTTRFCRGATTAAPTPVTPLSKMGRPSSSPCCRPAFATARLRDHRQRRRRQSGAVLRGGQPITGRRGRHWRQPRRQRSRPCHFPVPRRRGTTDRTGPRSGDWHHRGGIGPCYQDKVGRNFGVRVGELLYPDHLRTRLRTIVARKNRLFAVLGVARPSSSTPMPWLPILSPTGAAMRPHIHDTVRLLHEAGKQGKRVRSRVPRAVCSTSITAPSPT